MRRTRYRAAASRYVNLLTTGTLAIVMAGGRGERLRDLTLTRCKPAMPFGGKFRIVDFVLSNCVNSGIRQIYLMTQYKGQSLIQHVHRAWSYLRGEFGEFIDVVPAQQQIGTHWYRGTADCIYQNLDLIRALAPAHVLVLAGDHIYKMDYGPMIALHDDRGADITIGVVRVPIAAADKFGVLSLDDSNRVVRFEEKPAKPQPIPGSPEVAYASMGIYVFNAALLEQLLLADAADATSGHDFGQHIIPATIEHLKVFAYPFTDVQTRAQSYWRDVGTVDAYYDANMELVHVEPELNLYDEEWPIWTYQSHQPPAKFVLNDHGRRGMAINSLVSGGCIVSGALIEQSMLFSGVHVHEHSHLLGSVVLPDTRIGPGCNIHRAIIDEGCDVPAGLSVGQDRARDAAHFHVTENGVVLITRQMLQARTRLEA